MNTSPFSEGMAGLLIAGWEVVPLPARRKAAPPSGTTGRFGKALNEEELSEFSPFSNLGIRLPENVVGLDFDLYKSDNRLPGILSSLDTLPNTVGITSSNISESVTLFFKIPAGVILEERLTSNVEVIQHNHRYSVCPPSVHPSGRSYRWVNSDGFQITWVPSPIELPALPESWLNKLVKEEDNLLISADEQVVLDDTSACPVMRITLTRGMKEINKQGSSRHEKMLKIQWSILATSAKGHSGGAGAEVRLRRAWTRLFSDEEKSGRSLLAEWEKALEGARGKIPIKAEECSCRATPSVGTTFDDKNRQLLWMR